MRIAQLVVPAGVVEAVNYPGRLQRPEPRSLGDVAAVGGRGVTCRERHRLRVQPDGASATCYLRPLDEAWAERVDADSQRSVLEGGDLRKADALSDTYQPENRDATGSRNSSAKCFTLSQSVYT
jgi:hypothetical protein